MTVETIRDHPSQVPPGAYHYARDLVDLPVIPRERRDAARQAEIAQRRPERYALAKQRKNGASVPDAGATDSSRSLGLTN